MQNTIDRLLNRMSVAINEIEASRKLIQLAPIGSEAGAYGVVIPHDWPEADIDALAAARAECDKVLNCLNKNRDASVPTTGG